MLVEEAELLPCVAIHGWSGALRLPWTMKPCLIWALVRAELLDGYSCSSLWMSMKYEDEATHSLLQQLLLFLPPALQSWLSTPGLPLCLRPGVEVCRMGLPTAQLNLSTSSGCFL